MFFDNLSSEGFLFFPNLPLISYYQKEKDSMHISCLEFKNLNSYGSKLQRLEFPTTGQLILLCGPNGGGKSSIKQAIDICCFRRTQGKNGKKLALKKLANRRNQHLYTGIWFQNYKQDEIVIKQTIEPNTFDMWVNDEPFGERFKKMTEGEREHLIGFSYDVFKSFISLNIGDFKNFIALAAEDKKNLLNKLFKLDDLDHWLKVTKELEKVNTQNLEHYRLLLHNNKQQLSSYQRTLSQLEAPATKRTRMTTIKELLATHKMTFEALTNTLQTVEEKMRENQSLIKKAADYKQDYELQRTKLSLQLETIAEKIAHYRGGVCPVCQSDLHQVTHQQTLVGLEAQAAQFTTQQQEIAAKLTLLVIEDMKGRNTNQQLYKEKTELTAQLNTLKVTVNSLKTEYGYLKEQVSSDQQPVVDLTQKIATLTQQNEEYLPLVTHFQALEEVYQELKHLFTGTEIRAQIITSIIQPINEYLGDFLTRLASPYRARLDANFDAHLCELETLEIDPETISKGEDRKINLAIALSYLKLILGHRHANLLFLDEIFDGIDVDNIDLTLQILKEIAVAHELNIICVHHGLASTNHFDRVLTTTKTLFSDLEDRVIGEKIAE